MPVDNEAIYTACLKTGVHRVITGNDLLVYVSSPFAFYCDQFVAKEERDPISNYQRTLMERGRHHETKTVEEDYPEAVNVEFVTEEEGFRKTLEMMSEGQPSIYNMPLIYLPEGMRGRPDLLRRVDGYDTRFGSYGYEVIEIKSAKNIREKHEAQTAFYTRLLGQVQGATPEEFHIINGEGNLSTYNYRDRDQWLDDVLSNLYRVLEGETVDACYGSCPWPWETYGNGIAIETKDVSLIPGVGPSSQAALKDAGFTTVAVVAGATPDALLVVRGIGAANAAKFHTKALSIISGKITPRRPEALDFTEHKHELFLDLEGTDPRFNTDGLAITNYLIGMLIREGTQVTYRPFFAESLDKEAEILEEFCQFLSSMKDYVLYHWHSYERTHLKKMLNNYGLDAKYESVIFDHMVDLSPITTKAFAFPTYSDGLKAIAKSLGFNWRQDDVDALESVYLYALYIDSGSKDTDVKGRILTYNEDDCIATMHIKDWLAAQSETASK